MLSNNLLNDNLLNDTDSADKTFIPVFRRELIKKIISDARKNDRLDKQTVQNLHTFTEVLQTIYHARYHRHYISLKQLIVHLIQTEMWSQIESGRIMRNVVYRKSYSVKSPLYCKKLIMMNLMKLI